MKPAEDNQSPRSCLALAALATLEQKTIILLISELKYFLMIDKRKITITENILRSINIVISIIIVILIWIKIEFELKLHFSEKKITEYDNIFSLGIFPASS